MAAPMQALTVDPANYPGFFPPTTPAVTPPIVPVVPGTNTGTNAAGGPQFSDIQKLLAPSSTGISPQIQTVLDLINKNTADARSRGIAEATSMAAKRGLAGSSIEQFGISQAAKDAETAGQTATANVLLQNANQQADLQKALASLTSDEIASLRNMDSQQASLALQKYLGEKGIQISAENIQAAKDSARQKGQNNLISSIIGATLPTIVSGIAKTVAPGVFGTAAGTTAGTGAAGAAAGAGSLPSPLAYMGAELGAGAAGYYVANKIAPATQPGDQAAENVGAGIGGVAGAIIGAPLGAGPLGAGLGSAIGTAVGKAENRLVEGVKARAGETAGEVVKYSNPIGATVGVINMVRDPKAAINQLGKNINNAVHKVLGGGSGSDNFETQVVPQIQEDVKNLDAWKAARSSGQITEEQYYEGLNRYLPAAASWVGQHAYVSSGANDKMRAGGADTITEQYVKELNDYNKSKGLPQLVNTGRGGWKTEAQIYAESPEGIKAAQQKSQALNTQAVAIAQQDAAKMNAAKQAVAEWDKTHPMPPQNAPDFAYNKWLIARNTVGNNALRSFAA